jgi:hypothetical protein
MRFSKIIHFTHVQVYAVLWGSTRCPRSRHCCNVVMSGFQKGAA